MYFKKCRRSVARFWRRIVLLPAALALSALLPAVASAYPFDFYDPYAPPFCAYGPPVNDANIVTVVVAGSDYGDFDGVQLGTVFLKHSSGCHADWVDVGSLSALVNLPVQAEIYRPSTDTWASDNAQNGQRGTSHSPMLYADGLGTLCANEGVLYNGYFNEAQYCG
jgi:hypothetical protein